MYKLFFINVFLLLLGVGCAVRPPLPETPETFVIRGKVAVTEREEHFSANLLWHQRGDGFEMDLWGPLGQGRMRIVREAGQIQLRNDAGVLLEGDPDRVMREALGWSLPLDVLPSWVQGTPRPGTPVDGLITDDSGRLAGFTQLGWSVALERFEVVGTTGRELPTRITASRPDARVRLVVAEWRL